MIFKKRISFILACLLALFLSLLASARTDGFEERKIYQEKKRGFSEKELLQESSILSQPFFYLGHGRQCYAFVSEDGMYVIKFFNFSAHKRPAFLSSALLPKFIHHIFARKEKRKNGFFNGYQIDALLAKEEPKITATLWVHLHGEDLMQKEMIVYDKWHKKHRISLQDTAFVVQRKVEPFLSWLEASSSSSIFQHRLEAYLDFLFFRLQHQIFDPDGRILDHLGLVDGALVSFDHGRIFINEKLKEASFFENKISAETRQMRKHLLKNHQEQLAFFEKSIQQRLATYFHGK